VADGIVEFPVTEIVPVPVPDGGAVITVDIPVHVVLSETTVETLEKLELGVDTGVEIDDVDVGAEPEEAELDESSPLQKPPTQVLKAHCESEEQVASKLPQRGISIEFTA
jgi:hypothetical protein